MSKDESEPSSGSVGALPISASVSDEIEEELVTARSSLTDPETSPPTPSSEDSKKPDSGDVLWTAHEIEPTPDSAVDFVEEQPFNEENYFPPGHEIAMRVSRPQIHRGRVGDRSITSTTSHSRSQSSRQFASSAIFQSLRVGACISSRDISETTALRSSGKTLPRQMSASYIHQRATLHKLSLAKAKSTDYSSDVGSYKRRSDRYSERLTDVSIKSAKTDLSFRSSDIPETEEMEIYSSGSTVPMESETLESEDNYVAVDADMDSLGVADEELAHDGFQTDTDTTAIVGTPFPRGLRTRRKRDTVDLLLQDFDLGSVFLESPLLSATVVTTSGGGPILASLTEDSPLALASTTRSDASTMIMTSPRAAPRHFSDSVSVDEQQWQWRMEALRQAPTYRLKRRLSSEDMVRTKYLSLKRGKNVREKRRLYRRKSDPGVSKHTLRRLGTLPTDCRPHTTNLFLLPGLEPESKRGDGRKTETERRYVQLLQRLEYERKLYRELFYDSDLSEEELPLLPYDELPLTQDVMDVSTTRSSAKTPTLALDRSKDLKPKPTEEKTESRFTTLRKKLSPRLRQTAIGPFSAKFSLSSSVPTASSDSSLPATALSTSSSYSAHTFAESEDIKREFGEDFVALQSFKVKKKDKWNIDRSRILVFDMSIQVLRVKDKSGKTHKEHIIDSIDAFDDIFSPKGGKPKTAQIKLTFKDDQRDYNLTFESEAEKSRFEDVLQKTRDLRKKLCSTASSHPMASPTLSPAASVSSSLRSTHSHTGAGEVGPGSMSLASTSSRLTLSGGRYTGRPAPNVGYIVRYTNRWGAIRTRTLVIHLTERVIRLFDEKRNCKNEFPVADVDVIEIFRNNIMEAVFAKHASRAMRPLRAEFQTNADLCFFVEQMRMLKPTIMLCVGSAPGTTVDSVSTVAEESKGRTAATSSSKLRAATDSSTVSMEEKEESSRMTGISSALRLPSILMERLGGSFLGGGGGVVGGGSTVAAASLPSDGGLEAIASPFMLRFLVLRLVRTRAGQSVTWKQHRRVMFLNMLSKEIVMKSTGMHMKHYAFSDVVLLEKSYANCKQLHITVLEVGGKGFHDYWYEFMTAVAREEFVGRVLANIEDSARMPIGSVSPRGTGTSEALGLGMEDEKTEDTRKRSVSITSLFPVKETGIIKVTDESGVTEVVEYDAKADESTEEAVVKPMSGLSVALVEIRAESLRKTVAEEKAKEKERREAESAALKAVAKKKEAMACAKVTDANIDELYNEPLSILVGSWNVGESEPAKMAFNEWFPPPTVRAYDLYVIGLQECDTSLRKNWVRAVLDYVNEGRRSDDRSFTVFHRSFLLQIGCFLIVRKRLVHRISHVENQEVATGKGNMIGNKGAACISFELDSTQLCFVCCHLAARAERVAKRAKDAYRIFKRLDLGRPSLDVLHQFDHLFWFGDLNYRVDSPFATVCRKIEERKWADIWKFDQLLEEMRRGTVYHGFQEGVIDWPPTYRWERHSQEVSNKREQSPSYCDRILFRSLPEMQHLLRLLKYTASPEAMGSDHRPIYATFELRTIKSYFSSDAHFALCGSSAVSGSRPILKATFIDLVGLRASFNGLPGFIERDNVTMLIDHKFVDVRYRIPGGRFDPLWDMFQWPALRGEAEMNCSLEPFIRDPYALSETHIHLVFVNKSKGNAVMGYCSLSLRDAFSEYALRALEKTRTAVEMRRKQPKDSGLLPLVEDEPFAPKQELLEKAALTAIKESKEKMRPKKFSETILLQGQKVGSLHGFATCQLEICESLFV